MEDAKSVDHLAGVLTRVTGAGAGAIAGMEDWISKTALATGVTDDQLRPAIEKLATATHSVTKAQELANVALDIAAATGKDVDTVSVALAKGYQGQTAAMAKLVPGLSEGARKSKDFEVILAELAKTTGGASAQAAETAAGKMARFSVATGELQESIGYALLPAIEAVIPVMLTMAKFAEENVAVIKILVGVVAGLAAGILAANVALKAYEAVQILVKAATVAWTAVQWLLNAALTANPIGIVTLAIAALAAGIVIAYNKSETFRDIVQTALGAVRVAVDKLVDVFGDLHKAAAAAFNWIVDHWKVALFAFGPIGLAIGVIVRYWDELTAAARTAAGAIQSSLKAIAGGFSSLGSAIGSAIATAIGWIDDLLSKVSSALGAVRDLIGWIARIPKIPSLPSIPGLGSIPTPWMPAPVAGPRSGRSGPTTSAAGGLTINVYGAVDPEGTARAIRRVLAGHDRRQGFAVS
jgi:phage-related protein